MPSGHILAVEKQQIKNYSELNYVVMGLKTNHDLASIFIYSQFSLLEYLSLLFFPITELNVFDKFTFGEANITVTMMKNCTRETPLFQPCDQNNFYSMSLSKYNIINIGGNVTAKQG